MDALFTVAFNTWMMNGYFKTIPKDIEEAALIDGCSRRADHHRVMIPIAVPGLVTVMIYAFIFAWNEFLFGLTFISSKNKMPLTIALYNFVGRWTTQWQYLMHGRVPRPHPGAGPVLLHREEARGGAGGRRRKGIEAALTPFLTAGRPSGILEHRQSMPKNAYARE